MPRNVELKVRCDAETLDHVERRLAALGHPLAELHQTDTYLVVLRGRLKLREIHALDGNTAELIAYARPDDLGTRTSDYTRTLLSREEGTALLATLRAALDVLVVVEKRRRVAVVERTRVHLDRVSGLGTFIELETVLAAEDDEAGGRAELGRVVDLLTIGDLAPIAGSYSDLLLDPAWATEPADAGR